MRTISLTRRRKNILLICLIYVAYVLTGFAKSNFTASITFIVEEGIFTKSETGAITTAFYIFYGIGQLIGGAVVDRISPYRSIKLAILALFSTSFVLSFTMNYTVILIVWSLGGLLQFGLWPGVSRIVAEYVSPRLRASAIKYISTGLSVSSLLSYACSAVVCELFGWSGMFTVSAATLALFYLIWLIAERLVPEGSTMHTYKKVEKSRPSLRDNLPLLVESGILFAIPAIFCIEGMLSTGLRSWIPTIIMETYHVSPSFSNLLTVLMLFASIVGAVLLVPLFRRIRNTMYRSMAVCLSMLVPCILLLFLGTLPLSLVVICLGLESTFVAVCTSMTTENNSLFARYGLSATMAGLINAVCCGGVSVAGVGFGFTADTLGWNAVTAAMLLLILLSLGLYALAAKPWQAFTKRR